MVRLCCCVVRSACSCDPATLLLRLDPRLARTGGDVAAVGGAGDGGERGAMQKDVDVCGAFQLGLLICRCFSRIAPFTTLKRAGW